MRRLLAVVLTGLVFLTAGGSARADQPSFTPAQRAEIVSILRQALASDPSILRDAITALQADEARNSEAAATATITRLGRALTGNSSDPVVGNPHGDMTMVVFYDLHCPYCRRMEPVLTQLLQSDPKLRLVYKDIPILGPGSKLGARAVLAAEKQGGYAKLQSAIMTRGGDITDDSLRLAAAKSGLDWDQLKRDMDDPTIEPRLRDNLALAQELGIDGTPAFVIGKRLIAGAVDLSDLQGAVAEARAGDAKAKAVN
jgi:protein-disulfide isomerase